MHTVSPSPSAFSFRVTSAWLVVVGALLALASGCAPSESDVSESQESNIIDGHVAHGYAEAVHVNRIDEYGQAGGCSGVLVAPRVVLTAAHCIVGYRAWGIYAPFADGQGQVATEAEVFDWYDWKAAGDAYPWDRHDVGVILLDEPIVLDSYPTIAAEPVEHGAWSTIVGRVKNGFNSPDWLFASDPTVVLHEWPGHGVATGRYYTVPEDRIQRGDSGGPVFPFADAEDAGAPRTIIGVVATTHGVFRVETVRSWIQGYIGAP